MHKHHDWSWILRIFIILGKTWPSFLPIFLLPCLCFPPGIPITYMLDCLILLHIFWKVRILFSILITICAPIWVIVIVLSLSLPFFPQLHQVYWWSRWKNCLCYQVLSHLASFWFDMSFRPFYAVSLFSSFPYSLCCKILPLELLTYSS